jgi:hypothetical protein
MTSDKKLVFRAADCDTSRLYDVLPKAIAYLKEMQRTLPPDASLEENWTGYETMEMRFCWHEPETDDEYADRLEHEQEAERRAAKERVAEAEKRERRKQWEKLNQEFGRR